MSLTQWIGTVATLVAATIMPACNDVDDNRIPAMPVNINLSDPGMWNSYGVHGFGNYRLFVPPLGEPAGFHYAATAAAGYGGILLIGGMDPFTADTELPLAYDLACPVECNPEVRVAVMESQNYDAVCPGCGSHFDVTMRGGAPVSGVAATGKYKYGLKRYTCVRAATGGYLIVR